MTQISLDEWVAQFKLQAKSRALWKAIRWEFEVQQPPMTVRQMFYRMSSAGMVPKLTGGYRAVQYALTAMRKQRAIDYGWLADHTRWVRKPTTYRGLADMLTRSQAFYRRALWSGAARPHRMLAEKTRWPGDWPDNRRVRCAAIRDEGLSIADLSIRGGENHSKT